MRGEEQGQGLLAVDESIEPPPRGKRQRRGATWSLERTARLQSKAKSKAVVVAALVKVLSRYYTCFGSQLYITYEVSNIRNT